MNILEKTFCRAYQIGFRIALPILPYRNPEQLNGIEAIPELLRESNIHSILLVADGGVRRLGLTEPLEEMLADAGIQVAVYEQNRPNPTISDVEEAREIYLQHGAAAILAVGGGSAIDCGKVVGARIAKPKQPVSKMKGILRVMRRTPLFIAVPTTAGTGSEATLAAVITDGEKNHKYPINDFFLIPDYAVLEPKLTLGLPPFLTATTGLDALTHAVEAYIGRSTNRLTRAMSEEAVTLIYKYLRAAYHNGADEEARAGMLRASYCAGVSFSRSYVGYVHGVAHSLGGQYGIAHGLANAVILPVFLDKYGKSIEKKLARLARKAGIVEKQTADEEASRCFIDWVKGMNEEFALPHGFAEIRPEDIPVMARHAASESNPLYPVPVEMNAKELEPVYEYLMGKGREEAAADAAASEKKCTAENGEAGNMSEKTSIEQIMEKQRAFYATNATKSLKFRHEALRKLRASILAHEKEINAALAADLSKGTFETYMVETGMTLAELSYMDKHIDRWSRPKHVATPLAQFAASSFSVRDPYGIVLVMSPWNYPFMLTMEPVIGALAGGNCCVVKPSAYSPATSAVIKTIIEDCFPQEYVAVVEGGRQENQSLLKQKFDYICFTGGVTVGKEVMRNAAEHLTPVTLELGGKSPCVVDDTANLKLAAKRLAFGKLLNCGQTCVAPDYLLIDRKVQKEFLGYLMEQLDKMVGKGEKSLKNKNYVHMINQKHFDRVMGLIDQDKVIYGGKGDPETLRIQPTIMVDVTAEDAVMQEEIFGPVLPVITYDNIDQAISFINSRPHPLSCYLFTGSSKVEKRFLKEVPFGGGCINDTIIHIATSRLGFGGVGNSGMGSYHGKKSFDTFTHEKSIVKKYTWFDLPVRYAPYSLIRYWMLRMFLR